MQNELKKNLQYLVELQYILEQQELEKISILPENTTKTQKINNNIKLTQLVSNLITIAGNVLNNNISTLQKNYEDFCEMYNDIHKQTNHLKINSKKAYKQWLKNEMESYTKIKSKVNNP